MKRIILITLIFFIFPNYTYSANEIINEQKETFKINEFIKEANKYTEDMNAEKILNEVMTGKFSNKTILEKVINLFLGEIKSIIKTLLIIISIILIHSILKNFTDNFENKNVSQIVYYVQYILIVTIIMANFTEILNSIRDTISNLVGFTSLIIPLMISLMIFTGNIVTANMVEPILLFLIEIISNLVEKLLVPLISMITILTLISKISNKVQIKKLSKFFKSSINWILGLTLTLFVGVLSLEGSLTSSIDGITAKTTKAAVSSMIPVVRKSFRR